MDIGFYQFKISTKEDLPNGTTINNRAGIYFDNNSPIITNTVTHTIKEFSQDDDEIENNGVCLFPNPSDGIVNIILDDRFDIGSYDISILNVLGQKVYTSRVSQNMSIPKIQGSGTYFYNIIDDQKKRKAQGKFIVH